MEKYFKKKLISKDEIKKSIKNLASKINKKYKGEEIVAIGLLKGAFIFIADIIRELDLDLSVEFLVVKSYENSKSSGKPKIVLDIKESIFNKKIIIFEDIADTGRTLKAVKDYLEYKGASDVKIATLLSKPSEREVDVDIEWNLFNIENDFVVGYGLDYNENFRNLKDIMVLSEYAIRKFKKPL
ncbi:MAG: hypoxanthine phosphoribosyltransferase [Mycoplasmatales bacterium]|nr:hypoxanthine phosphoribosyltransferase [Mycoplasmatales bacterium]